MDSINDASHIIIAYANLPAPAALLHLPPLILPALQTLAQGDLQRQQFPEHSPVLAHEACLMQALADSPMISPVTWRLQHSAALDWATEHQRVWFELRPVHIHISSDQMVLTNPADLNLSEEEAQQLFDSIAPLFDAPRFLLKKISPAVWGLGVQDDTWRQLLAAPYQRALRRNVQAWLPQNKPLPDNKIPHEQPDIARTWRKLANEISMTWHAHPLNQQREERGLPTLNAAWLTGWQGDLASTSSINKKIAAIPPSNHARAQNRHEPSFLLNNDLEAAWLNEDWHAWCRTWHTIDKHILRPALARKKTLRLSLCGESQINTYVFHSHHAYAFWRKRSPQQLLSP